MKATRLKEAVHLAKKTGHVFIATADADGMPHIAAAGRMELADDDSVMISEWFCPGTVRNLQINPHVSVVVWDKHFDSGCQLLGHLEAVKDIGIMDGYTPDVDEQMPLPQVEKQLLIQVESILDFKLDPHTDTPEQ